MACGGPAPGAPRAEPQAAAPPGDPAPPSPAGRIERCVAAAPTAIPATVARATCGGAVRAGVPGFALAWAEGDQVATVAHGVRCAGGTDPVTATTRFRIGSITKTLVAVAAAAAEAEGRVDLDRDVRASLPSLRIDPPDPALPLRSLLDHTSGIVERPPAAADGDRSIVALGPFRRIMDAVPSYSNTGFALGARGLAAALGGLTTDALLAWGPLAALGGRLVVANGRPVPDAACGHLLRPGEPPAAMTLQEDYRHLAHGAAWAAPAGAAAVAPADLARFFATLPRARLRALSARRHPDPAGGPAWILGARLAQNPEGAPRIVMTGQTGTFWALLVVDPGGGRAVVLAANAGVPLLAARKAVLDAL